VLGYAGDGERKCLEVISGFGSAHDTWQVWQVWNAWG
jgi:hypothetical protein